MPSASVQVLSEKDYEALVSSLENLLEDSRKIGRKADRSLVDIYWRVGDMILTSGLTGRSHYGRSVIEQMSEKLKINPQTLRRTIQFRRVYEQPALQRVIKALSWSHFRILMDVRDENARRYYEDRLL